MVETPTVTSCEIWTADAMKFEELLCQGFILRQIQGLWTSSGVRPPKKIKVSRDVHFLSVVAGISLGKIEKQICIALSQTGKGFIRAVERDIAGLVAQFLKRLKDLLAVVLLTPTAGPLARFALRLRLDLHLVLAPGVVQNRDFEFVRHMNE